MGSQPVEFEEFAACLRALKERTGLSYGSLARQTRISSSSLHRYCSGSYVPQDYGPVHRFATACGASPEELRRLHRLWALADAAREPDGGTEAAPDADPAPDAAPLPAAVPTPRPPWYRRTSPALVVLALVLVLGATAWGIAAVSGPGSPVGGDTGGTGAGEGLLFSPECAGPVSMGQHDVCVREVQRLLAEAGADLDVDGEFGPQTLRRVTAFQTLSRTGAEGVVGEETKKALYAPKVRMDTWPPGKVRQRIREVFREVPDRASALAHCHSSLDPLHIVPNLDGTRNWGVFQLSDARLRELGGTPRDALDPEWNIQAAHRLWSRTKDFGAWPRCDRASSPEAVGPALVQAVDGRPTAPPRDAPSPTASPGAACPAPGQRFKTPTDDRVYLVGPGRRLYYLPDAVVYFNLWNDWNGVAVVSGGVFADCAWDEAHELADAFLVRTSGSPRAYLWDAWYGYRLVTDRAAFDKYGFSEAKIQTRSSLSPVSTDHPWQ